MIVQGDNGIIIPFVASKPKPLNLNGAAVEVSIKRGNDLLIKIATIIDAANGKCEFQLSSSDLTLVGTYIYQWKVTFEDGRILHGKKQDFYASEKITAGNSIPDPGAGGTITVRVDGGVF